MAERRRVQQAWRAACVSLGAGLLLASAPVSLPVRVLAVRRLLGGGKERKVSVFASRDNSEVVLKEILGKKVAKSMASSKRRQQPGAPAPVCPPVFGGLHGNVVPL